MLDREATGLFRLTAGADDPAGAASPPGAPAVPAAACRPTDAAAGAAHIAGFACPKPSMKLPSRSPSRPSLLIAAGTLALLAACAAVVRHKTLQVEARNPPRGRFVEVDGVQLHYLEQGDADRPALVLLHGNGVMATDMELSGLLDGAAGRFRVLAFDRPGYGHSERPAGRSYTPEAQAELLLGALDALGVRQPLVLGHSWGAMVATAMAVRRPDALRGLVLASGYYTPSARLDVFLAGAPAIPLLGTLMRHTVSPLLGRALWPAVVRRLFSPAPTAAAFKERYPVWMSLRPGQLRASAAEAAMMIPAAARLLEGERELKLPVVIVAGDQDRLLMTRWQSRRLHERVPGSRFHGVPEAGHMVHHTAPGAVLAAIDEAAAMADAKPGA